MRARACSSVHPSPIHHAPRSLTTCICTTACVEQSLLTLRKHIASEIKRRDQQPEPPSSTAERQV